MRRPETGEAVKGAEEGAAETVEKAADEADEAAKDAAETAEQAVEDDKKAAAPAESDEAKAQNCLDLVDKSQFEEAVSACLKALDADPGNLEVQEALLKAQSATAGEGASGEAKGAATGAVGDAMAAAETADKAAAPPDQLCLELVSNSQFEQGGAAVPEGTRCRSSQYRSTGGSGQDTVSDGRVRYWIGAGGSGHSSLRVLLEGDEPGLAMGGAPVVYDSSEQSAQPWGSYE